MRIPVAVLLALLAAPAIAQSTPGHDQTPGQRFHLRIEDLPAPVPSNPNAPSASPIKIERGTHLPIVPSGFTASLWLEPIGAPRRLLMMQGDVLFVSQQYEGRLLALRDSDGNGTADSGVALLEEGTHPFGLALVPLGPARGDLLVSDPFALYVLPIATGSGEIHVLTGDGAFGDAAGHITRELATDPRTGNIYVAVGSTVNLGAEPAVKATIQRFQPNGSGQATFATGLRNVTGMDFEPSTGALYAVVMERDGMGDALVPDFLTRIEDGDFFGWPWQYLGGFVQPEFANDLPKLEAAKLPDVLFEAHSAPLDLAFIPDSWPEQYRGDALVALHGSANAGEPRGYKLVRVLFENGRPTGEYENFMTGFWVSGSSPAEVWGRPASLAFGPDGALYVGDDFGNSIWKVVPARDWTQFL